MGGKIVSISHLAARHGWALPAYYNSMNPDEILTLQALFEEARKNKRGIWPHFDRIVGQLNLLKFRKGGAFGRKEQLADRGPFVVPKIFHRQLRYSVLQQNNLAQKTFRDYLAGKPLKGQTQRGSTDAWTTGAKILANPTMKKPTQAPNDSLAGLLSAGNAFPNSAGIRQLGDIVFFEQPSTLRKKKGAPITTWTFV